MPPGTQNREYPEKVMQICSKEYYVNMMRAWYFATALAKQYENILPFIEEKKLDVWTHNKTCLLYTSSHQLKTPVAALDTCFSVLMQNDLSATEQEEFRIRCRSALDGLETLLQSLLEISKMETGLIQMNKKKLPLMDTVISLSLIHI